MIEPNAISGSPPPDPLLDFDRLFQDGLSMLEAGTDGRWTDFNTHDPGITILELLCYALNDLAYRAGHAVPDLLAGSRLADAAGELSSNATTTGDVRRVALDVEGIRNAWVEPAWGGPLSLMRRRGSSKLEFDPGTREGVPSDAEAVALQGVYRVLLEKSPHFEGANGELVRRVALRVHAERNLCEDFDEIRVLETRAIAVNADLEISDAGSAEAIFLDVFERMDRYMSPSPNRTTNLQRTASGATSEEIFEGPLLSRGFVDLTSDGFVSRRTALHSSDLIAELARVPGVRAVRSAQLGGAAGESRTGAQQWSLLLGPDQTPVFDAAASSIRLFAGGIRIADEAARTVALERFRKLTKPGAEPPAAKTLQLAAPNGRDRQLDAYRPLSADLPAAYGVREGSLPLPATPERRAAVNQLRAYLAIFDQLLANYFGQLASFRLLISADSDLKPSCYATKMALPEPGDPLIGRSLTADALAEMVENTAGPTAPGRRERFLAHLLARVGEQAPVTIPPGAGPDTVTHARQTFLRNSVRLSRGRGTGVDYFGGDASPLTDRVHLKLGLPVSPPKLLLIEHILLRPIRNDEVQMLPVLHLASSADPYSLQLTFVIDDELRAMADAAARVVREETPAHLTPYLMWVSRGQLVELTAVYQDWLASLKSLRQEQLGIRI